MKRDAYILLVEDNEDDILLTLRAFKQNGLVNDVIVVRDGVEAVDFLYAKGAYAERDASHLPQVVLLDINLPKRNGIEVLREIRSHDQTKLLPVVMLTTSQEERDIVGSYGSGANSYVRKPVDFHEFGAAVRQLGMYWLVLNEPPK